MNHTSPPADLHPAAGLTIVPVSTPVADVTHKAVPLRRFWDRARQIALFEAGGLLLITPPFAWASGVPLADSLGMLALIALIAALWNAAYNIGFDWVEGRRTGRTADRRPWPLRVVHALGFETGLLIMTLPIVMAWTGMDWLTALIADLALAVAYTVYAFVFNLTYDRLFPIRTPQAD